MTTDTEKPWEGHPWATAEHRTVGSHRAWCHGCGTWCYPDNGCWCCNEPAYEWLLAEAERDAVGWMCQCHDDLMLAQWLLAEARDYIDTVINAIIKSDPYFLLWLLLEARWWADWLRWQYGDDCPDAWPEHMPIYTTEPDGDEHFLGYNLPWEEARQP